MNLNIFKKKQLSFQNLQHLLIENKYGLSTRDSAVQAADTLMEIALNTNPNSHHISVQKESGNHCMNKQYWEQV